jgi:hypothetical protein
VPPSLPLLWDRGPATVISDHVLVPKRRRHSLDNARDFYPQLHRGRAGGRAAGRAVTRQASEYIAVPRIPLKQIVHRGCGLWKGSA